MSVNGYEASKTILVVDDSESALTLSRQTLENLGYEVACVMSGAAAIRWLIAHPVSLVLLDYRLPDMTGREVVCRLAKRGLNIPFVTITAHGDEKLAVEMKNIGALDYLAKDHVFAEMLPSVVGQVLGRLENERRVAVAERAAKESEGRFRSIFENAAAGMAQVSPQGNLLQVNPELCRFLGYEPGELLKLDILAVTHPGDRITSLRFCEELRTGERSAFNCEKRYVRRDGSTVWGHATAAGVRDESGNLRYCVVLVQDITDRKRYEDLVVNIERGVSIVTGDHFFRSLVTHLADALKADIAFVGEFDIQQPQSVKAIAVIAGPGKEISDIPSRTPPARIWPARRSVSTRKRCAGIFPATACWSNSASRDTPEPPSSAPPVSPSDCWWPSSGSLSRTPEWSSPCSGYFRFVPPANWNAGRGSWPFARASSGTKGCRRSSKLFLTESRMPLSCWRPT
jgi:PAS domain S-box-containing protein